MAQSVKSQTGDTALLLGAGYTAMALISPLQQAGYHVYGTTRSSDTARILTEMGATPLRFDGQMNDDLLAALKTARVIISSIPPQKDGDPVLRALSKPLKSTMPNAAYVAYLSATSVYGDRDGHWVFEEELLFPTTQRGRRRMEAELAWLESGLPVHVFRLAGIYGPTMGGEARNPFEKIKSGQARAVIKPGHKVNRIHVTDIARVIMASLSRPNPVRIYNVSDGHPCPPQDVLDHAAKLLGMPPPPHINLDVAQISDMARSFYRDNKQVSNARARTELGWKPLYPTYQDGLRACLSDFLP